MATTPRHGIPYQGPADQPDGAGLGYSLASWLDDRLAPADRICHVYWGNPSADVVIPTGTWADLLNDTVTADPYAMRQADNVSFKLPWDGRYSLWTRVSLTSDDAARTVLGWQNKTLGNYMAIKGVGPVYADTPFDIYTEETLSAGQVVRPQMYRNTNSSSWIRHYLGFNGNGQRTQSIIRWLGPV